MPRPLTPTSPFNPTRMSLPGSPVESLCSPTPRREHFDLDAAHSMFKPNLVDELPYEYCGRVDAHSVLREKPPFVARELCDSPDSMSVYSQESAARPPRLRLFRGKQSGLNSHHADSWGNGSGWSSIALNTLPPKISIVPDSDDATPLDEGTTPRSHISTFPEVTEGDPDHYFLGGPRGVTTPGCSPQLSGNTATVTAHVYPSPRSEAASFPSPLQTEAPLSPWETAFVPASQDTLDLEAADAGVSRMVFARVGVRNNEDISYEDLQTSSKSSGRSRYAGEGSAVIQGASRDEEEHANTVSKLFMGLHRHIARLEAENWALRAELGKVNR
ncbi:hypothetical protein BV25DRAFT_1917724 [Artomyces pyxidatus]|uniref:Uncharacterized protein n=1 Tax=Artomyces pyxidatus TaxID=48021 RepID=A0ACB8SVZ1_9AGAM|nr:hypothetical protein BV25DRAFT_1917724 [Artomyces pyxidatus]